MKHINAMIDAVIDGAGASEVLETYTRGLVKASTLPGFRRHLRCECGYEIPQYPGRYPKVCPHCGAEFIPQELGEVDPNQD